MKKHNNFRYLCSAMRKIINNKGIKMLLTALVLLAVTSTVSAQVTNPKETPRLEFVMQLRVTLGEAYSVGDTPHGRRMVIPITGGTFEGPQLKGTILNCGADYQLGSLDGSRTELEAIYSIKTHDGTYIHVRNRGIIYNGKDSQGNTSFYFKAAPQFEAPANSPYAWLNNAIYVCQPEWDKEFKGIVLNVWRVI